MKPPAPAIYHAPGTRTFGTCTSLTDPAGTRTTGTRTAGTRTAGTPARSVHGRQIAAAAAEPILDLLTGPLQPATVFATLSAATLLAVDSPAYTRVVALLTREASDVPNGLRVAASAADRPFAALRPRDAAFIGAGGVRLPGAHLVATRVVRTGVPAVHPAAVAAPTIASAAAAASTGVSRGPVDGLRDAFATGGTAALRNAVAALVGLGAGSTPGGDDVLAGLLTGLHAMRRTALVHQVSVAALEDVAERTTLLSADLLRLAAAGHACTEALGVLRASQAHAFRPAALDRALLHLLSIGHTSGADLATGLAIGLGAPPSRSARRPRLAAHPTRPAGRFVPVSATAAHATKEPARD